MLPAEPTAVGNLGQSISFISVHILLVGEKKK